MTGLTDTVPWVAARTGLRVARERLWRRPAVTREDVPGSVDDITPAWWQAVLAADVPDAVLESVRCVSGSNGTHFRHCFALDWNDAGRDAGLPANVFTKSLPTVVTRMIGGYNGTARAEGRFYLELRPALEIESPIGYHSAFDRRSLAGINVIEDIATTRGARFLDFRTHVTREMAEGMVDLLAALHGRWYADPGLAAAHRWLANFADWYRIGARKMKTEHYTGVAIRQLADALPPSVVRRAAQVWPATERAAAVHEQGPQGLLHSDVHIGNWYQTGAGQVGLCDWQCVARGHGSRDLAYLLATALLSDERRAWERELVQRYAAQLEAVTGVAQDANRVRDEYRRQMLHALWMWTITLCHSPLLPAMQPVDQTRELVIRVATAMDDLDSLDACLG